MIKELCVRRGITHVHTSKLFFGTYTTSLTINLPEGLYEEYNATRQQICDAHERRVARGEKADWAATSRLIGAARSKFHFARSAFIDSIYDAHTALHDAVNRTNNASVTFYLDNPECLALIIAMRRDITKVTTPRNLADVDFLRSSTGKVIRERYYLNDAYPFRIQFKTGEKDRVANYVTTQYGNTEEQDSALLHFYSSNSPILYFASYEDVFLAEIGLSELIQSIDEVVLQKDI